MCVCGLEPNSFAILYYDHVLALCAYVNILWNVWMLSVSVRWPKFLERTEVFNHFHPHPTPIVNNNNKKHQLQTTAVFPLTLLFFGYVVVGAGKCRWVRKWPDAKCFCFVICFREHLSHTPSPSIGFQHPFSSFQGGRCWKVKPGLECAFVLHSSTD